MGSFSLLRQYGSKCQFEFGSSNSQFKPANKNSNSRGLLWRAQPYSSKCQFENGASAPEFEPFDKITNANPKKGEVETEIDETVTINENIHTTTSETGNKTEKSNFNTVTTKTANEELKTEIRGELNTNIESKTKTKNEQTAKTKNKINPPTIQKFSNHIKFIDYIPTHEIITYRHLFAYGFYVE